MNKVILTGRIANDLELRATTTGKSICDFRLATNRPVTRDGEKVADFINCRVWNKRAENLAQYQKKGNLIAVIGRMQVEKYTDKDGKDRYSTYVLVEELEYLERKKEDKQEEKNEYKDMKTTTEVQQQFDYTEEELPF
jgi:single-strand DNA-binding protein